MKIVIEPRKQLGYLTVALYELTEHTFGLVSTSLIQPQNEVLRQKLI
ncbi:hypothetical protein [Flagellimonas zhangzhouensis]|nr:hypothetical protein [Allomuricauda zhangzhouensis]